MTFTYELPIALMVVFCLIVIFSIAVSRTSSGISNNFRRPWLFSFALSSYFSAWSVYGTLMFMDERGISVITLFIGTIILFVLGRPLLMRLAHIARSEGVHSQIDFLGARYGHSDMLVFILSALSIPVISGYIYFQYFVITEVIATAAAGGQFPHIPNLFIYLTCALFVAILAVRFGRRPDEDSGFDAPLLTILAVMGFLKITALVILSYNIASADFSTVGGFGAAVDKHLVSLKDLTPPSIFVIPAVVIMSLGMLVYPHVFHFVITEAKTESELKSASHIMPVYVTALMLCMMIIYVAGEEFVAANGSDTALYMMTVPLAIGDTWLVFLSLFTFMTACLGISIAGAVVGGTIISKALQRFQTPREGESKHSQLASPADSRLFSASAVAFALLPIAPLVFLENNVFPNMASELLTLGLQIAPALVLGIFWRGASKHGALAAIIVGVASWAIFFFHPSFDPPVFTQNISSDTTQANNETQTFLITGIAPILLNTLALIIVSKFSRKSSLDKLQAQRFTSPTARYTRLTEKRGNVRIRDLIELSSDYLGKKQARNAFAQFSQNNSHQFDPNALADPEYIRFADQLITRLAGSATSKLLLSLLIERTVQDDTLSTELLNEAKHAIHFNRALLQNAIDHVSHGIAVFDSHYKLVAWNTQFNELLDLPASYLGVGQSLEAIVDTAATLGALGADRIRRSPEHYLMKLTSPGLEFHEILKDGTTVSIQSNALPDGGFVLTLIDVTEYIATQRALTHAKEDLELRVRERTLSLSQLNDELVSLSAKAHELNASKTRFLAAAGHDIMQPLSAARLYASQLKRESSGTPFAEQAENLSESLGAAEDVIEAVLQIARLDSGSYHAVFETIPLNELFVQTYASMEPIANEKGVSLNFVPTSCMVRTDQRLVGRILRNLVSNAIKYTPGGKVLFGARHHSDAIVICILDSGIGIHETDYDTIFQEFKRLNRGIETSVGTGLGLSIVRRLATVLGTEINVRSKYGEGSQFSFMIDKAKDGVAIEAPQNFVLKQTKKIFADKTLLCIDSDSKFLSGLKFLLQDWGCKSVLCDNAEEALDRVAVSPQFDLILCGNELDGSSGLELISEIRYEAGINFPAAVLTEFPNMIPQKLVEDQQITVIRKPMRPAAMRAFLEQTFKASNQLELEDSAP